jgi:hypothetical protein
VEAQLVARAAVCAFELRISYLYSGVVSTSPLTVTASGRRPRGAAPVGDALGAAAGVGGDAPAGLGLLPLQPLPPEGVDMTTLVSAAGGERWTRPRKTWWPSSLAASSALVKMRRSASQPKETPTLP